MSNSSSKLFPTQKAKNPKTFEREYWRKKSKKKKKVTQLRREAIAITTNTRLNCIGGNRSWQPDLALKK